MQSPRRSTLKLNGIRVAAAILGLLVVSYVSACNLQYERIRPFTPGPIRWFSSEERAHKEYVSVVNDAYADFQTKRMNCARAALCEAEASLDLLERAINPYISDPLGVPSWMREKNAEITYHALVLVEDSVADALSTEVEPETAYDLALETEYALVPWHDRNERVIRTIFDVDEDLPGRSLEDLEQAARSRVAAALDVSISTLTFLQESGEYRQFVLARQKHDSLADIEDRQFGRFVEAMESWRLAAE